LLPSIPDPPTNSSEGEAWIDALLPSSLPPEAILNYSPIKHTGFLNRIPKPIQIDDDSVSTTSSIVSRRPSLQSYTRPSTALSGHQSDQLSGNIAMRSRLSLLSMDASKPIAEVRSRAKSTIAFSDAALARRGDHTPGLDAEDKTVMASPLNFTRMGNASAVSLSPPVTATTLNNESMTSFTVYESPQEQELDVRPKEDSDSGKKWFSGMKKKISTSKVRADTSETLAEPKAKHLLTLSNPNSTPESPLKSNVRLDKHATERRDEKEKMQAGTTGGKQTPRKTGGTVRRVWRTLVGRT